MKKFIVMFFMMCFSLNMVSREITKNPDTGLVLTENAGIYSLKSSTGVMVLGDLKESRDIMNTMNVCFMKEKISEVISCSEQKYKVKKDDDGMYIMRVGLGAVKVRATDSALFFTVLEGKIMKDKGEKIWKVIKE